MLKRFGYYAFCVLLIVVFGLSGLSDVLSSKFVFIMSGTIMALSLMIALWLTVTRKSLQAIDSKSSNDKLPEPAKKHNRSITTAKAKTIPDKSRKPKTSGKTRAKKARKQ